MQVKFGLTLVLAMTDLNKLIQNHSEIHSSARHKQLPTRSRYNIREVVIKAGFGRHQAGAVMHWTAHISTVSSAQSQRAACFDLPFIEKASRTSP